VPMLVTDMQNFVSRLMPKALPATFGTPELVDRARAMGCRHVQLLLPPVSLHVRWWRDDLRMQDHADEWRGDPVRDNRRPSWRCAAMPRP
jgi:hypothetical protein